MKKSQTIVLLSACVLSISCLPASGQAVPAGIGTTPSVGFGGDAPFVGNFNYSLNASELFSTGYYGDGGTYYSTNLSGDAVYQTKSEVHPFSLIYTGGVLLQNSSNQPTTTYQSLALTQFYKTRNWNFNVEDAVSYLPESPVSGLSGIPGVGDLGIDPVPVSANGGIGILTTYGPRVSNTISGGVSRILTRRLSAQAQVYQETQQFIGDNSNLAVNNTGEGASAGLTYRLNARSSVAANYNFSRFTFNSAYGSLSTQGATATYTRQWSRRLITVVYAGPQAISSSSGLYPSSVQVAAGGSASYNSRSTFYTLSANRGINNGSGVIPGSFGDSLTLGASRIFAGVWNASANLGYSHTSAVPGFEQFAFSSQGLAAGGQVSRAITRRLYGYGSYTVEHQTLGHAIGSTPNAFNGNYQIVAVGVSYSPRRFLFGR